MKSTINFTDRKSIYHDDIKIKINKSQDGLWTFEATLDLSTYDLIPEGIVCIEAYRQSSWMRFSWGTVAFPEPSLDRSLTDFDSPEEIKFRVKVVASNPQGQLLAEADAIRPMDPSDDQGSRTPLLPVKPHELGDEAWKVEISDSTTKLLINPKLGDVHDVALSPAFRTLVYPAAMRQILERAICLRDNNGELPTAGEPDEWPMLWVRFCQLLPGIDATSNPFDINDDDGRREWIDDSIAAFCRKNDLRSCFSQLCLIEVQS